MQILLRKLLLLSFLATVFSLGCSKNQKIPAVTTPDAARQTLTKALDAWKAGTDVASLAKGSEALYVAVEEWKQGSKLGSYTLLDQGSNFGTSVHFMVDLHVTSPQGNSAQKRAKYIVSTIPVQSVSRDDAVDGEGVPGAAQTQSRAQSQD